MLLRTRHGEAFPDHWFIVEQVHNAGPKMMGGGGRGMQEHRKTLPKLQAANPLLPGVGVGGEGIRLDFRLCFWIFISYTLLMVY